MSFFGISATFVSLICSLVLVRGSFQASLLGISVMTGSVRLYLPCNGHYLAIATKAPGRKRKPIILQSSVICYCGKMVSLVPGEVFCGIGLILFVITNFMSMEFYILTSYALSCIDSESSAQMPSRFDFASIPSSILITKTRQKLSTVFYNFLLRYCGTFIKKSILSSVKICCRVASRHCQKPIDL